MFGKLKLFYELFQEGRQVSNPAFWKKGQAYVQPIVAGLIMSIVMLLKSYGYNLPVSDEMAVSIAGALFFVVNTCLTIISSKHIGLPTGTSTEAQQAMPSVQQATDTAEAQEAVQPINSPNVEQTGITDDVIARARAWAAEHGKPAGQPTAFDSPTYYNP